MEKQDQGRGRFGAYFNEIRKASKLTLRAFCTRADADPGNISKMERGLWPPPQDHEILERYARALGIEEGNDEWYRFFDMAAAERGLVPQDLMTEPEVIELLPVFFRTLRGQKASPEDMRALVDKLKRS